MKKYNPCLGIASTKREAAALVEKLGQGHAVQSGGKWRVMKYPPGEVGRHSLGAKDWRGNKPAASDTEGK